MPNCPCCSDLMLRHASAGRAYFLCQRCRMEMPEAAILSQSKPQTAVAPVLRPVALPQDLKQDLLRRAAV